MLSLPLLDLRLGQEDVGQLPEDTTARQAYDAMRKGFGDGANGPFLIAVKLDPPANNDQKKLNKLNDQIAAAATADRAAGQRAGDQITSS